MKWALLLAGAILVGLVLWLLPPAGPEPPAQRALTQPPVAAQAPAPAAPPAPVVQQPVPEPPAIVLGGLLYRGKENPQSQALLAVRGRPQQPYSSGDAVGDGWVLRSIEADHVLLAKGATTARLEVVAGPAPVAVASPAADAASAAAAQAPLPGFALSPPPRAAREGSATERNRRFLQAAQSRRAASQ